MTTEPDPNPRQSRVKEIFTRAWELKSAEERRRYLEEACGEDRELRQTVESLLEAHESNGTFLSRDVSGEKLDCSAEGPGSVIGPYRLLERLGEGGFGEVYRAEQTEPVKRQVALKIIKAGMDTREVIARFEAERQALALMNHPNIARVLDAGTTGPDKSESRKQKAEIDTGRPYFVMELACGEPITKYCDSHCLPLAERLKLFQQVCGAVQHAHQKGIIHRDLKPSNVVVTVQDSQPVPKIIDFGIAKSLQGRLTDRTLVTCREMLLGTPAYMSPEQVAGASADLDTRTDIYSLGVLLYELVAGVTPFENDTLKKAALAEVQRIIREVEPPKPSTRVHTLGAKATEIAERRHIESLVLERTLRGDLDWIVMKAIEKDRGRRYDSATELANELQRHLRHEPVQAGPPNAAYRARKFVRRHRVAVGMTAAVTGALVIGLGGLLIGFARANQAQERAETEAAIAKAVNEFLQNDLLGRAFPWDRPQKEVTIQTVLDRAAESVGARFRDRPLVEAEIHMAIFNCYQLLGKYPEARAHLDRAREIYEEHLPAEDLRLLGALRAEALLLDLEGHLRECQMLRERLLPVHCRVLGPEADVTLRLMWHLARSYTRIGKLAEAQKCAEKTLAAQLRLLGPEHRYTLDTKEALAVVYRQQGRLAEAQALLEEVLAVRRRISGPEDLGTLNTRAWLADTFLVGGKAAEAEPIYDEVLTVYRRILGPEHLVTLRIMRVLAASYANQGKLAEAQQLLEEALANGLRGLGPGHPETLRAMHGLADMHDHQGKHADAQKMLEEVVDEWRTLDPEHPAALLAMGNLAVIYAHQGNLAQAEKLNKEVLAECRRVLGPVNPQTLSAMNHLADTYYSEGKTAEAQKLLEEVLPLQRRVLGPEHPQTLSTLLNLANACYRQGKMAEAQKLFEEMLPLQRRVLGPEHPVTLFTMNGLAWLLATCADPIGRNGQRALDYAEQAVTATRRTNAAYLDTLAAAYAEAGQFTNAVKVQQEAIALLGEGEKKKLCESHLRLYESNSPCRE